MLNEFSRSSVTFVSHSKAKFFVQKAQASLCWVDGQNGTKHEPAPGAGCHLNNLIKWEEAAKAARNPRDFGRSSLLFLRMTLVLVSLDKKRRRV